MNKRVRCWRVLKDTNLGNLMSISHRVPSSDPPTASFSDKNVQQFKADGHLNWNTWKTSSQKKKTQTYEMGDETSIELTVSNKHYDSLFSS